MVHGMRFRYKLLFMCIGFGLLMGCSGFKVVGDVKYYDRPKLDPPYSPREQPAKYLDEHEARLEGAVIIGHVFVDAVKSLDRQTFNSHASKLAASLGADTYNKNLVDRWQDSYTDESGTYYGAWIYTWAIYLYRIFPDLKEKDIRIKSGLPICADGCTSRDLRDFCYPSTLSKYLAIEPDLNSYQRVPLLYEFIDCLLWYRSWDPDYGHHNYKKLEMLLDAGVDPNMPLKGDLTDSELKRIQTLKGYSQPYPSVLELVRDRIETIEDRITKLDLESKEREYLENMTTRGYWKSIEALLIEKGARVREN